MRHRKSPRERARKRRLESPWVAVATVLSLAVFWLLVPLQTWRLAITLGAAAFSTAGLIRQGVKHPLRSIARDRYDPLHASRRLFLLLLLFSTLSGAWLLISWDASKKAPIPATVPRLELGSEERNLLRP